MSSNKLNEHKELSIDLDDRRSDNSITEIIKERKSSDKLKVNLKIKSSSESEINNLELDTDLFCKIKDIQDLPDWVIVKLILATGKLKSRSFKERLANG